MVASIIEVSIVRAERLHGSTKFRWNVTDWYEAPAKPVILNIISCVPYYTTSFEENCKVPV